MDTRETQESVEPIAIVGMAGRFPGASDTDQLWSLLMERGDAIGPIPVERWDTSRQLDPEKEIQKVGGFVDGVDLFDAGFFGISPREAAAIDPQQRLLLEVSWQALEDAGVPAASLTGTRTGVYAGASWHDYELLRQERGAHPTPHSLVGNALDVIAARVSYAFGLRGPSMTVETGCSSSLVALHLAVQALRQGEIEGALVGGTNLMLDPHVTIGLTHFGGLSPDGRCATFSDGANGFVRGEGVAALYVKTLRRALADGDRIHGVVAQTAVNNDGGGDSLVTPSQAGQEDLLRQAYGPLPDYAPAYVEAHGTGTGRGDPIETSAIGRVLGTGRSENPVLVGSIKTNIGHLEASAGLAGLFKLLLAMRHRVVPPSLHSQTLNPDIPFDDLNLRVVREPTPLPDGPLTLGVNSFGWGGTNAHVVVATAPEPSAAQGTAVPGATAARDTAQAGTPATGLPLMVPLSAQRAPVLAERAVELRAALRHDPPPLPALASTLARRRDHFPVRAAVIASDTATLTTALEALAADPEGEQATAGVVTGRAQPRGRTAFVFPGQGSQWRGMGRDLYRDSPLFAGVIDRCADALRPHVTWDLTALFAGTDGASDDAWMTRIDMLQPTLWAMSLGLAELWRARGVEPDVVLGHSQGEITAATLAGILSYEDAALVMARRSAIARRTCGHGRMLAVDLDREAALAALEGFEDSVSLAVHNGPRSCVLSGDEDAVLVLKELLAADGVFCRLVNVDYASHSPQMDALRDDLLTELAPARPQPGTIDLMSTVRVGRVAGEELDATYWADNLRQPVRFADAMGALLDEGVTHVVEISPHPVLTPAVEQLAAQHPEPAAVLPTLRRDQGTPADAAAAIARGYVAGLEPFGEPDRQPPVPLPGYPLHRESYWIPARARRPGATGGFDPALVPVPGEAGTWSGALELSVPDLPWLGEHAVHGTPVLPGAAMLTLAVNTARARTGSGPTHFDQVDFVKEIALGDEPVRLAAEWRDHTADQPGAGAFRLLSLPDGGARWDVNATVRFRRAATDTPPPIFPAWWAVSEGESSDAFYEACDRRGLEYGPAFRGVQTLYRHPDGMEVLGEVVLSERLHAGNRAEVLHPALTDGALQVSLALWEGTAALVPTAVRAVRVLEQPSAPVTTVWSRAIRRGDEEADIHLFDQDHRPLVILEGLRLRALPTAEGPGEDGALHHHLGWAALPAARSEGAPPSRDGQWVVCGDDRDRAEELVTALMMAGLDVAYQGEGSLADVAAVVYLPPTGQDGPQAQQDGLLELTRLVTECAALGTAPHLIVVTDRAQGVLAEDQPDPGAALYWGFTRALRREHPELTPRLVDVTATDPLWASRCAEELLAENGDDQVAIRRDKRFAARLHRGRAENPAGLPLPRTPRQPFRVGVTGPGTPEAVACLPLTRRAPGPGEVEIEVRASALGDGPVVGPPAGSVPVRLGAECAGVVVAVAPDVTTVAVGDRVAAAAEGAAASHVTVRADHVQHVPDALDDDVAAVLPLTMTAAWHAVTELGGATSSSTVLVHSAADGVGFAAQCIARALGARVLTTAGDPERRSFLHGLGLTEVFDSSDPGWADAVRAATGGRGVDIVLNTLTGSGAAEGLGVLADDGRFVELEPSNLDADRRIGLDVLGRGIVLTALDPVGLLRRRPATFARSLGEAWSLIADAKLALPTTHRYGFREVARAVQARSVGAAPVRFVLIDPGAVTEVVAEPRPDGRLRADGTYLITGGLGGLGLSLADHLAAEGAGALVLMGRSAPSVAAEERVAALRAAGTTVRTVRCDVQDDVAVRRVLAGIRADLPPLRGVVHAAGLLADATVANVTPQQVNAVLAPKLGGARVLDAATAGDPLDFLVLFSSAAALVGNAGQAVYAAANASLDALAQYRRSRGLPALSVQWGPFSDVGLAADDGRRGARLAERGMESVTAPEAWPVLLDMLDQAAPVNGVVRINPRQWFDAYPDTAALGSWRHLHAAAQQAGGPTGSEFRARLLDTPDHDKRVDLAEVKVRELSGRVLRLAPEQIDSDTPFKALGLDSLLGLELRNRLEVAFGITLSPTLLWAHGHARALSRALCDTLAADAGSS